MIVTSGTHRGQAKPDGRRRFHPINDIFRRVFFGNDSALGISTMIAIEPCRDLLIERRFGQQITGQLVPP